ncbi:hypothetical protein EIP91_007349 [Steccherinum ochraceum]|uniref:Uncharacterized protein n=1 Tax=Steccherinum ochraceum TaxID=92696 RepID=A0A4R0RWH1_9APHY|nr:hypothetical protein EIP91_007349 [Steccherinum ochraceum]
MKFLATLFNIALVVSFASPGFAAPIQGDSIDLDALSKRDPALLGAVTGADVISQPINVVAGAATGLLTRDVYHGDALAAVANIPEVVAADAGLVSVTGITKRAIYNGEGLATVDDIPNVLTSAVGLVSVTGVDKRQAVPGLNIDGLGLDGLLAPVESLGLAGL